MNLKIGVEIGRITHALSVGFPVSIEITEGKKQHLLLKKFYFLTY